MDQQHSTMIFGKLVFGVGVVLSLVGLLLILLAVLRTTRKANDDSRILEKAESLGPILILIGLVLVTL